MPTSESDSDVEGGALFVNAGGVLKVRGVWFGGVHTRTQGNSAEASRPLGG